MRRLVVLLLTLVTVPASFADETETTITSRKVCEIRTSKWEKDVSQCQKGDVLSIFLDRASPFSFSNAVGRLCDLDKQIASLGTSFATCIYTGSALEIIEKR